MGMYYVLSGLGAEGMSSLPRASFAGEDGIASSACIAKSLCFSIMLSAWKSLGKPMS